MDPGADHRLGRQDRPGHRRAWSPEILDSRPHPEQGYRAALGIIRLAGRYGPDRAEAACARALRLRSYSYRSVESILRTGLDRQPLPGDKPALPRPPRPPQRARPRLLPLERTTRSCSPAPPSTG